MQRQQSMTCSPSLVHKSVYVSQGRNKTQGQYHARYIWNFYPPHSAPPSLPLQPSPPLPPPLPSFYTQQSLFDFFHHQQKVMHLIGQSRDVEAVSSFPTLPGRSLSCGVLPLLGFPAVLAPPLTARAPSARALPRLFFATFSCFSCFTL